MGKKINIISGQTDFWQSSACTKFIKDFAVTFAYAFRYYITGLIIGYFLCVTFKKCYNAWTCDWRYRRPLTAQSEDPNEERPFQEGVDDNQEQIEDGCRKFRIRNGTDWGKSEAASRNLDALPHVKESSTALNYWKQYFDNFGFVVVDNMNPTAPFGRIPDTGNSNGPHRSPMTLRWESNLDRNRGELGFPNVNKSSSTTDIQKVTHKNVTKYSQVMAGDLKCISNQDMAVDTQDLVKAHSLKNATPKRRNRKVDNFRLKKVGMDEFDFVTSKNDVDLSVPKKKSTTSLKDTVESSLIPGQKVAKNAVIVLRLRDKHLSSCDVFDENGIPIPSRKKLDLGNRKRIKKKTSYYRMTSEKRNHRDSFKLRRDSGHVHNSDEDSSESVENHQKSRNLLSFTNFNRNPLQCPFSKKRNLISDEKSKNRIGSKKRSVHNFDAWERRNPQSQIRHSSKQMRPDMADKGLQSQNFSRRSCFRYKKPARKRQKTIENPSKPDIKSLSRFFSDFRKSNHSSNKQSIAPIWTKNNPSNNEDVYQIEVQESANGLRIRSRSRCGFSETPPIVEKVNKSIESSHSNNMMHMAEPPSSRSRHMIEEASHRPEPEEPLLIGKRFGTSMVSIGISKQQPDSGQDQNSEVIVTNYSDISTGSESVSAEELTFPLEESRKTGSGSGKVDELIVALGESCNGKNSRSQFWKIFGSKNAGKSN